MSIPKAHTFEVWAQLILSKSDRFRIRDFFVKELGLNPLSVIRNPHLTVYHARRPMPGITLLSEPVRVVLAASQTRFMVMAPGGENPRPNLDPGRCKVGIRVHRQSNALNEILRFRDRLLKYETQRVLGKRAPSTHNNSAFGARYFQPHMVLLAGGSGVDRNLTKIGIPFRETIGDLTFDRFVIDVVRRSEG